MTVKVQYGLTDRVFKTTKIFFITGEKNVHKPIPSYRAIFGPQINISIL